MTYTQSMTFSDLRTEVRNLRFNSNQDNSINRWINAALARIWNADEWTFKYATAAVSATTGSNTLGSLPSDFGIVIGLQRADGTPLRYMPPRAFFETYFSLTNTGAPQHYTVVNGVVTVGPISNETSSTYELVYEKRLTNLVADGDTPAIPAQHHYLIVEGALSQGLRLYNDFTWQFMENGFLAGLEDMRKEFLSDQRGENVQWGRDSVESLPLSFGV